MSVSPASRSLRSEAISKWHGAWYPYSKRSRRVMWTVSARMAPQSVTRRFAILGGEKFTEEQEEQGTPVVGGAGSVVVPISLIIHSPEVRRGPRVGPAFPDFTKNLFSTSSTWSIDPGCNHFRITCSSHPRDRSFDYVNFILEF